MRHFGPVIAVSAVLLAGCQPQAQTAAPVSSSSSTGDPAPAASAPPAVFLTAATEIRDASGTTQDQKIESADATPENVAKLLNGLDWKHPHNGCGIALTRAPGSSSPDHAKLSISFDAPETGVERVIRARLEETPPGESDEKYYSFQPIESPEFGLQLLLSFLAQDGKYRTMVEWQEIRVEAE